MSDAKTEVKIVTVGGNGTFDEVISAANPTIRAIARECRKLIAEVMPGVTEVPWANQRTVGYGVGPKKMSQHFCYLAPQRTYLNIGFFYGAELDDPGGLLEGTGKMLRHIKIRSREEIQQSGIREILKQASTYLPKLDMNSS